MAPEPQPKYHHHVPKFLIQNWAGRESKVWSWNRFERITREKDPLTVLGEKYANRFIDLEGQKNVSVEHDLASIESDFSICVRDLLSQLKLDKLPPLGSPLVVTLNNLFWNMIVRSPHMRARHKVNENFYDEQIVAKILAEQSKGAEFQIDTTPLLQDSQEKDNLMQHINVLAFGEASLNAPSNIHQTGIAILIPQRPNKSFVLGLNPVGRILVDGRAITALPVAPNVAISPFGPKDSFSTFRIDDNQLRSFNTMVWNNSDEVVSSSQELLISLSEQR